MATMSASAAGIGLDSLRDWKAWDLYTRGFNAAGNAIESLGEATGNGEVAKVTSFINNTFFGGDTTDETLAALQNTCNEILETTQSIENIVNEINSKLSKSLINESKKDCNEAWKEQVTNQFTKYDVATYNFSHIFDAYCRYLASASGVEIEGMQSGKTVEDYNNDFISELKKYYTNAYNGVKPPVVYESTLYENAWMDTVFTGMVDALLSEMDPKSSVGVKGERFIDCVADCAFKSFPFSSEQAEYVDTAAQYQINYVTCVLMMYQDYAARRVEYMVKQDGFTDQYGTKISAEEWWNGYTDKNGNVVAGYYDEYYLKTFDNYNNTIEKFLTGDIYLADAGVYTKLDKYVRYDSASVPNSSSKQNFTLTNDKYLDSYEAKSGSETQTCKAKYTSKNMKFYKNAQVSIKGNELVFTPFYILNGDVYNTNLSNFSKDKKENGIPGVGSFQYYFTSCDYKNLKEGEYTDGTNIYTPVENVDEVKSLVSENPYTAYYKSPYGYFSDYVSYGSGKDLYIILDGDVKSVYRPKPYLFPYYSEYPYFKLNQDLTYVDTWSQTILSEYDDNKYTSDDLYALFLVPQNDELRSKIDLKGDNISVLEISDCPTTDRSGNPIDTYNENDGTALSGERVNIKVSDNYSDKYYITSVKVQYHNDNSDPTKVTDEKVICKNVEMTEFDYPVPYSNVTLVVEVEKYKVPDVDDDGNYLIENYNQLLYVAGQVNDGVDEYVNGKYLLVNDIDCSEKTGFVPIGQTPLYYNANPSADGNWGFKGTFDGQGHVIKNLTIKGSSLQDASFGIFGTVSGTVKRLGVENLTYTGAGKDSRVGGIAGQVLQGGKITDCYAKNSSINTQINTANGVAGGIAGANYSGTVENCYTYNVSVTAGRAGGIVGDNCGDANNDDGTDRPGTVKNCYTTSANICNKGTSIGGEYHTHVDRFTSGRVTYLLNKEVTDGKQVWYQNVDNGEPVDDTPVLISNGNNTVYFDIDKYTNKEPSSIDKNDDGVFVIKTYEDLCNMSDRVNRGKEDYVTGSYILANDIKAPDASVFATIGTRSDYFEGTFDGQGHTISGLNIDTDTDYVGLFGYSTGTIKNVGVIDSSLSGNNYVGGIAGYNSGTVDNCYNTGTVSGVDYVGGIVAYNAGGGTVTNCYNTGKVSYVASDSVIRGNIGGIVGTHTYGTVSNCYNTGTVIGDSSEVGGIVGDSSSTVTHCYNNGTVSGTNNVGGIVGYNNNGGKVSKSYNTGNVSGKTEIGGVVGKNWRATLTDCYNIGEVSGNSNAAGIVGSSGNSTIKNTYYLNTSCSVGISGGDVEETIVKTAEQFASGEVAYLLNNGVTDGTQAWYQNIGGENADPYPVLDNTHNTVFKTDDSYKNGDLIGDINRDGVIDTTDLTRLGEYIIRQTVLTADEVTLGDVNGDGKTDPNDLAIMKAYVNQEDADYANTGKYGINTMPTDALLVGDVNFDGVIDQSDADLISQFNVEMTELTDEQKKAGDIDLDGHLSSKDMAEINKYMAIISSGKTYTGNIGKYSYKGFDMTITGGQTSTAPTVPKPDDTDANSSTSGKPSTDKTDNNTIQTGNPVNCLILLSVLLSGLVLMFTFRRYKNK